MSIEEFPESSRCPDCGTWLPGEALSCPKCGRPREVAVDGLPGRKPASRRVIIGGGVGVALLVGVVILWAINRPEAPDSTATPSLASGIAQASPSARPTPRFTPTGSRRPTRTAAPSRAPTQTPVPVPELRGPLLLTVEIPDIGRRAIVIAAGPRARGYFGAPDGGPVLGAGSELLLRDGPVTADGYDWYLAYFQPGVDAQNPFELQTGWVAAGLRGQEPTLIEIGPLRCPAVPMTVALLGSMTDLARRECLGDGSFEVHGVAENCYLDGIHPYVVKPEWLGPFCRYRAYELGTNVSVPIHFPPLLLIPNTLSRGDLVRIVGHVNGAAAEDCLPVPTGDIDVTESQTELALQQAVLACRSAFVISELEITGHIDLANPFGF